MTFREILIWLALALLAGALALAAWWGWAAYSHVPLKTSGDFAARSLLREMPEGAVFAAAVYGAGGALPPAEAILPWLRASAGPAAVEFSEDDFRAQYEILRAFLAGEAAAALYRKPGDSGMTVVLASRPRPSFWPKMLFARAKERVRALAGRLPEKEGVYTDALPDGTLLSFAYRNGAVFLSTDAAALREPSAGVFADANEARLGWDQAAAHAPAPTTGGTESTGRGVLVARLGDSLCWGTLSVSQEAIDATWAFDAGIEAMASPVPSTSPGWEGREKSALAVMTAIPESALDASDYDSSLPVRLEDIFAVLAALRTAYVFPPSDGDALPAFVACLAPAPERRDALRESIEGALQLASWSVEQRTGGLLSPKIERRRNGDYDVAALALGVIHPCYADKAGAFFVTTQCRRLDPLLALPPEKRDGPEGGSPDFLRVEIRGAAMADCLLAFEGLAPMLGAGGMGGGGSISPLAGSGIEALRRVRLASLRLRPAGNGAPASMLAGTLSVEWGPSLTP